MNICSFDGCSRQSTISQALDMYEQRFIVRLCSEHNATWIALTERRKADRDRLAKVARTAGWAMDAAMAQVLFQDGGR